MIRNDVMEVQSRIFERNDLRELLGGYMHEQIAREKKHIVGIKRERTDLSPYLSPRTRDTKYLEVGASLVLGTAGAS